MLDFRKSLKILDVGMLCQSGSEWDFRKQQVLNSNPSPNSKEDKRARAKVVLRIERNKPEDT